MRHLSSDTLLYLKRSYHVSSLLFPEYKGYSRRMQYKLWFGLCSIQPDWYKIRSNLRSWRGGEKQPSSVLMNIHTVIKKGIIIAVDAALEKLYIYRHLKRRYRAYSLFWIQGFPRRIQYDWWFGVCSFQPDQHNILQFKEGKSDTQVFMR